MTSTIAIIDYGSGNLRSAAKAFEKVIMEAGLDMAVIVTSSAAEVRNSSRVVLPGQGAFASCKAGLEAIEGMPEALEEAVIRNARPFLGICVGMQLLASRGMEHGDHVGFDWIRGRVEVMTPSDPQLKIPHMGWNRIKISKSNQLHPLVKDVNENDYFYFVHSFVFKSEDKRNVIATAEYGGAVTAIVGRDNLAGVQFHPEKSQKSGLKMIGNFLRWNP